MRVMARGWKDGRPYYCTKCKLRYNNCGNDCVLESDAAAMARAKKHTWMVQQQRKMEAKLAKKRAKAREKEG